MSLGSIGLLDLSWVGAVAFCEMDRTLKGTNEHAVQQIRNDGQDAQRAERSELVVYLCISLQCIYVKRDRGFHEQRLGVECLR